MKKKWILGVLAIVMTTATTATALGIKSCSTDKDNSGNSSSNSLTEVSSSVEDSSSEVVDDSSSEDSSAGVEDSFDEVSSEESESSEEIIESSSEEISSEESSEVVESSSEEVSSEESSEIVESSSEEVIDSSSEEVVDSSEVVEDSSEESSEVESSESSEESGSFEDSSEDSSEVHKHDYELTDGKAATCTENGYETYTCDGCGDSYTQTVFGYGGHDLITVVEKEVTCTENGKIVTTCQRENCDYEKVTITYGSHNYYVKETQEATCTTDGYVLYHCDNCGEEYTLTTDASHNYVESGRVEAQVGVAGSITYTCTKCNDSYSIEIPALAEVDNAATVLLIQDNLPWAEDVNTALLKTLHARGTVASYNVVNTSALSTVTLTDYGVIFVANDQSTSMYTRLENYTDELTAYVNAGGVLIYGACDEGWGGCGSFTGSLPGGVTTGNYYSVYNYIVDDLHPVVTGVYTDGKNLYNELLKGNYCSHTYFNGSTLPAGTKVILQDGNGRPTLVEYTLGEGTVMASGLTWEYFYVRNHYNMTTNYSKYAFDDMLTYAITLATLEPCEHVYEAGETVEPTCADKGYTEYICTECGRVNYSDYVDATGKHDVGDWYTVSEPTCDTAGEQRRDCTICDYYETEEIPATGKHDVSDWYTASEPTCASAGVQRRDCTICDYYETEEIPATGDHNRGVIESVPPTCTEDGYTVYGCTECGAEKDTETLPATGIHSYNGYEYVLRGSYTWDYILQTFGEDLEGFWWIGGAAPICEEVADAIFDCEACGNSIVITVTGPHNYSDGSCTYCGEADPNAPVVDEETIVFLEDGTVNFGKYPQTKVTDSATTSALTTKAGSLPTVNAGGWTSYGYYISGSNATDYMWYQDVEYGDSKYRGVYFSSYRPRYTNYSSSTSNAFQDNNGYTTSTLYWFEYEWINWTISEETDGEYFLLCNSIIDTQEYYDNYNTRTIDGKTVYANNYAESNIRKWLNETFYETAFDELQQSLIQTTLVDNSAKSTNPYGQETLWNGGVNNYACENTNDKIFLLSEEEVTNSNYGFDSNPGAYGVDNARIRQTSDYAQSQGAWTYSGGSYDGNGYWWLRSPYYNLADDAWSVDYDGCADSDYHVNYTDLGVVPALKLVL